ncbi:MAG: rRNA (guanine-N1)-methyltransferase [SAR86 cluster bacterium]|uniref:rRNA (Guanine-N1)-methyltransferase n=1 Tax=SAR86 cluster bacterium TaxID=2030880 RepID=A0A2A4MHN8_9GAMM|nr:MAG: rRNA (guanine-N1)-methyltransferase [SAR86 cluster bacterium]
MWICPACQQPLVLLEHQSSWQCENKHSYDVAKQGYVNLLLANHKSSKSPGDSKLMINARNAFLGKGYYRPLVDALAAIVGEFIKSISPSPNSFNLFDAGCGEGYYLRQLNQSLKDGKFVVNYAGSDISKAAISLAARQSQEGQYAVASNFNLPLADNSQQVFLQIFTPVSEAQVHRVLSSEGLWLQVTPGAKHLQELKQQLYDTPQEHQLDDKLADGFKLGFHREVNFKIHLEDFESREQLLKMTPFYWVADKQQIAAVLAELETLSVSFHIRGLRKSAMH